jgi:hypothetical protein
MHTSCRLFVHIYSSCADFLNTKSVLCRPFADLMHTLSRANEFQFNDPRAAGARQPFLQERRSRGGGAMAAATDGIYMYTQAGSSTSMYINVYTLYICTYIGIRNRFMYHVHTCMYMSCPSVQDSRCNKRYIEVYKY